MSRLASTTLRIGDSAPPFSLPTLDGDRFQLSDLLGTGIGLLIFVPGSWSPGARRLVAELNELYPAVLDAGVTMAVVFTQDTSSLRRRLETRPPYPVLIDQARTTARDFGVYRAVSWDGIGVTRPAAFIIDVEGAIRFLYVGERDSDAPDAASLLRLATWLRGEIPLPERPEPGDEAETALEAAQVVPVAPENVEESGPEAGAARDEASAFAEAQAEDATPVPTDAETEATAGADATAPSGDTADQGPPTDAARRDDAASRAAPAGADLPPTPATSSDGIDAAREATADGTEAADSPPVADRSGATDERVPDGQGTPDTGEAAQVAANGSGGATEVPAPSHAPEETADGVAPGASAPSPPDAHPERPTSTRSPSDR